MIFYILSVVNIYTAPMLWYCRVHHARINTASSPQSGEEPTARQLLVHSFHAAELFVKRYMQLAAYTSSINTPPGG